MGPHADKKAQIAAYTENVIDFVCKIMFYNLVEYNFLSVKGGHLRLQSLTIGIEIKQWGVGRMLFLLIHFQLVLSACCARFEKYYLWKNEI